MIVSIGRGAINQLEQFGDFCRFSGGAISWVLSGRTLIRDYRLLLPQLYAVGTQSLMVVMITGAFIGAVLAVQTVTQLTNIGRDDITGIVVILSVLRELGPVMAGLMLAGRVGGALAAELGTMRVTEQIEALRAIGSDPIRILVVPRFIACILLMPVLVVFADFLGILGGYAVSVVIYDVNPGQFFRLTSQQVDILDIFYGPVKSIFFGAAMSLICCYKGFRSQAGAAGVGRACTESFVISCMSILALNFFLGMLFNSIREFFFGFRQLL